MVFLIKSGLLLRLLYLAISSKLLCVQGFGVCVDTFRVFIRYLQE